MAKCRQCAGAGYLPSGNGIVECQSCKYRTSALKIFLTQVLGSLLGAAAFFGGIAALSFYVIGISTPDQFIVAGIVTAVVCGPFMYKKLM